jgi:ribosomal protein S7
MKAEISGGKNPEKVGPSHPPKKNVAVTAHILNIFMYSAKKNIAKRNPEYSV